MTIIGINAPEREQPGFHEATNFMRELVLNRIVHLDIAEGRPRDRFGRTLAIVFVNGLDVNSEMVIREHAVWA
jgi:micrococcal nuclease